MALTWFLVLIVVKLFTQSTCISPVKPVCEDLSLQYVFFLVPPSSEVENLTKFLGNIDSAMIFETHENDGMVQVICDPKDWEKIYRYTKDRGIHFLHSTYCIEKGELSALQELRLRTNNLRKLMINEAPDNFMGRPPPQGKNIAREKESKVGVLKVLKNGRVIKTRAVHYALKKNGLKYRSTRTTNGKKDGTSTPPTKKSSKKSKSRRSVDTETEDSRIGDTFRRMKRYSWEILTKIENCENDHGRGKRDIVVNRREIRGRTIPWGKKGTPSKPNRRGVADDGESIVPSSGESDGTESTGTTDDIGATNEVISETTTDGAE